MKRVLYGTHTDLVLMCALGALPLATAALVGVGRDAGDYKGYFDSQWKWWPILLPAVLAIVRRLWRRIVPPHVRSASLVQLFAARGQSCGVEPADAERGQHVVERELLARENLWLAIVLVVVFTIADAWEPLKCAYGALAGGAACMPQERDWSVMFVNPSAGVALWPNLLHDSLAFAVQALAVGLAFLLVILCFRHNLLFTRSVYQEVRAASFDSRPYIAVDFDDNNRCFGFKATHLAFNTQVWALVVAGPIFLVTRIPNTVPQQKDVLANVPAALLKLFTDRDPQPLATILSTVSLFHDFGQVMILVGWLIMCATVMMPMLVKFLPLAPPRPTWQVVPFLREFFPEKRWPLSANPSDKAVGALANKFARNAFWPTGNKRAMLLFFFAFFILGWIIFPVPPSRSVPFVVFVFAMVVSSIALVAVLFVFIRFMLAVVDERLVKAKKD